MHNFINLIILMIVLVQLLKMKGIIEISDHDESMYNDYIQLNIIFVEFDFWHIEEQLLHYRIHDKIKIQTEAQRINYDSNDTEGIWARKARLLPFIT
jgi:hypothetical protein